MSKEVVKVFTDVTDRELARLLGRIKKMGKKMQSSYVEVEDYTLTDVECTLEIHCDEAPTRIQDYKKYRRRFMIDRTFNKVIWRYIL